VNSIIPIILISFRKKAACGWRRKQKRRDAFSKDGKDKKDNYWIKLLVIIGNYCPRKKPLAAKRRDIIVQDNFVWLLTRKKHCTFSIFSYFLLFFLVFLKPPKA